MRDKTTHTPNYVKLPVTRFLFRMTGELWRRTVAAQSDCAERHRITHLKVVKTVNVMLCMFHHNEKKLPINQPIVYYFNEPILPDDVKNHPTVPITERVLILPHNSQKNF